ncbi:Uncharacterised protein [Vibrio cholerae]|nr:Uncharacterised protein [Vibrio cholerae]
MPSNTWSAEPTIGRSTFTFLEIDDGSISICMIFALGQYFSRLLVVRSSKRTPTPKIRSALCIAILASYTPCMPSIPSEFL